jgi:hypothetical protein
MTSDSSVHADGSFYRVCRNGVAILIGFAACAIPVCADEAVSSPQAPLKPIVVTGKRVPVIVPDAVLEERVEDGYSLPDNDVYAQCARTMTLGVLAQRVADWIRANPTFTEGVASAVAKTMAAHCAH